MHKLIKTLSCLVLISAVSLACIDMSGADFNASARLAAEYNSGKFKNAKNICVNFLDSNPTNSNWLYNIGNCYYELGDLPRAMLSYNRALLVAPRDSDILENLNYVRTRLSLPELYRTGTPAELIVYLRDMFRPDEWLMIFSIAWCIIFIILIFRRFTGLKITTAVICLAAMACILAAGAAVSQNLTIYNHSNAIILKKNPAVYSLPTQNSVSSNIDLTAGEQVKVMETSDGWTRIRTVDNNEGWVSNSDVERIWPY